MNHGGPAFPVFNGCGFIPGRSLRDYFAAKAMENITNIRMSSEDTADWAYKMADAMLKAREK